MGRYRRAYSNGYLVVIVSLILKITYEEMLRKKERDKERKIFENIKTFIFSNILISRFNVAAT